MSVSMLLGGQIDVNDKVNYRCLVADLDLGAAQPIQDVFRPLLGDGSAVTGRGSDNRSVKLPVLVQAVSPKLRDAAVEALAALVNNSPMFTLAVTSSSGQTAVLDCFRGRTTPRWTEWHDGLPWLVVDVECPALPYFRSDVSQVASGAASSVQLGDFAQTTEYTYFVPNHSDTTVYKMPNIGVGPITVPFPVTGSAYPKQTSPAPIDGNGCMRIDFDWFRWDDGSHSSAQWQTAAKVGPVTGTWDISACKQVLFGVNTTRGVCIAYLTLKDSSNATQVFQAGANGPAASWLYVVFDISAATVNLAAITSWSMILTDGSTSSSGTGNSTRSAYPGELRAFPASSQQVTTAHAAVFKFADVLGSARTPAKLSFDRGGTNTMSGLLVHRLPPDADPTTPTLVPLSAGSGTTSAPSLPNGTFRVYSCGASSNVTIAQKVNGTQVATKTLSATAVPGTSSFGDCGDVKLPLQKVSADVTNVTYVITSGTSVTEVMLCDTRGLTVFIPTFTAAKYLRMDTPDVGKDVGDIYTSGFSDFRDAVSVAGGASISGSATLEPVDNFMAVYCPDGLPNVNLEYFPRWLIRRTA